VLFLQSSQSPNPLGLNLHPSLPSYPVMTLLSPRFLVRPLFVALCFQLGFSLPLTAQTPSPKPPAPSFHAELLKDFKFNSVVNNYGSTVPLKRISDKKYLFFYFSGKYCAPCKIFTPKLMEFYKKHAKTGNFEIVFISEDSSSDVMQEYMRETNMPWLALRFGDPAIKKIKGRLQQKGFPMLFLLDENDEVIGRPQLGDGDHVSWNPVKVWQKAHNLPVTHWTFDYKALQGH
jgi:thiol-disulfide isomerase/thioredoxin